MTSERWNHIARLFDEALECPPERRAAWLVETCGGDVELRDEVHLLLAAHEQANHFLEEPAYAHAANLIQAEGGPAMQTQRAGPYRLVHELNRGGMGTVYLAERDDGQFQQRVAVKLLRRGLDTDDIVQRFLSERQILASLHHPNIAHLIDGGVTRDGRPYFVMEYVEGQPLDVYCNARRLSVRERLKLFQVVCEAVQYAHRNLVVHRDLKPSNILVTEEGQVKLLDFGIAKLLNAEAVLHPAPPTQVGTRMMTPEYASPEQVRGEPITTASDVYQLGLLLYELLTGQRPYQFNARSLSEIERVICEQEPPHPSLAVTRDRAIATGNGRAALTPYAASRARGLQLARLQKQLRGDLDTIISKALRKEPARRYQSAEQLLEDVRRHLSGRPVTARPSSAWYWLSKFARRHRFGVAAAAAFTLLFVGFATLYTVRVTQERDRAQQEAAKAEQVADFMTSLIKEFSPSLAGSGTVTADEVLNRAVERVERELGNQPTVQANLLDVIGQVYQSHGDYATAERFLRTALAQRKVLYGELHPDVAESENNLAWLLHVQGNYDESERLHRQALAARRKLLGEEHVAVAKSLADLGVLLRVKGEYEEAEQLLRRALVIRQKQLGVEHTEVAVNLNSLAFLLYEQERYDEAGVLYLRALTIQRRLLGTHVQVAQTLHDYGSLLLAQERYAEAEQFYRNALAMRRKLLGDEHPHVAQGLSHLGLLHERQWHYDKAETFYREALAMRRGLFGDKHLSIANSLNLLGWLFYQRGHYRTAESYLQEALALYRDLLGEEHRYVANTLNKLAQVMARTDRLDEAVQTHRAALTLLRHQLPHGHVDIAEAEGLLSACFLAQGRFSEAEALLLKNYVTLKAARGHEDRHTRAMLQQLITLYDAWNKPEQSAAFRAQLTAAPAPASP